ncbi:Cof-type HAD-IIB family hydrolase [Vagococcus elongatus]|uniref:Haloacid dehalogenase n=1 Tax=Vagococcus elongatus TaxID=180344 RepID=A0A430AYJ9_9ENTE|nr:Cof-type HAD-IIB family hydrolase [Vagococcus elongatus]RSU13119.1 hypothetical protein CBF29_05470 [Vagococcus elongatus]
MIKLVAIDLDGTLLNSQKQISEENKRVIQNAKDAGVKVVVCTGRPLMGVAPLLEELNLMDPGDYTVTLNGGLIQKNDTGEILSETIMTVQDVRTVYELTYNLQLSLNVVTAKKVFHVKPDVPAFPSYYQKLNSLLVFEDKHLETFDDRMKINKMVCASENVQHLTSQMGRIPERYHEQYNIIRSGQFLFEFVHKEVSKAAGLKHLGEILNIQTKEMMAIGDEENDLPMIRLVGTGVAMGNATDEVKSAATVTTKSNDEDGVAYAIEKWVLNKR